MSFIEVKSAMGLTYLINPIWIKEVLMRDDGHWEIFFYRGDSLVISDGSKHAVRNLIDGGRE